MSRIYEDAINKMRIATGRRNKNDPDSTDTVFLQYIKDFMMLTFCNDIKVFEGCYYEGL